MRATASSFALPLSIGLFATTACGAAELRGGPSQAGEAAPAVLAPCPDSPNCVSSQAPADDAEHHVAPLPLPAMIDGATGDAAVFLDAIRETVETQPRAQWLTSEGPYAHATFTSRIFRWTDDVEFLVDTDAGLVHVRSASRVGHSDLGVNRARVEELRSLLEQASDLSD